MIFYDFEVFKYDWLAVFIEMTQNGPIEHVIVNDVERLRDLYEEHVSDIWVGFNNKHYDQYIMKGLLLKFDPKKINDYIIIEKREGWQYSRAFNKLQMINYDTMPSIPVSLKVLEGFMGSNIKETDVDFNLNRALTDEEIQQTVRYCRHDVEQTVKVFLEKIDEFNAMYGIVTAFPYVGGYRPALTCIGDSEARITAKVLGCEYVDFDDEFDYFVLPCVRLNKYKHVREWFEKLREDIKYQIDFDRELKRTGQGHGADEYLMKQAFYKQSLTVDVAGVPHTFGFGGLHGAPKNPLHATGLILHVDVGSYYPSMLIAWDLVTRAATRPEQYKHVYDTRMELKHAGKKKEQGPYKKLLNALSGAMKDKTNPAYDPRNNNVMCINGQLMLLDLIEHLEVVPGFELIQSNTDGLIIRIPDTDEAFNMVDDICWEWEQRCSTEKCKILLELDTISEIYQKDVNNYLWLESNGKVERKGAYVKSLSTIDYDLPIVNKALVDYMTKKIPVEQTIYECDDLIMFQKLVKLSGKYTHVEHEHCQPVARTTGVRVKKTIYEYPHRDRFTYKCYRVFASSDIRDGRILKCGGSRGKAEKFGSTPDHCFIDNDDMTNVHVPAKLDREWYVNEAKKRLKQYGIEV